MMRIELTRLETQGNMNIEPLMQGEEGHLKISATLDALTKFKKDAHKISVYRITITSFGWGGPVFGIVRGEQQTDDYVETFEGIKVVVENALVEKFGGFNIEYSNFWLTRGFYIRAQIYGSKC